jgi:amino acid adenylation domain-containing protein
METSKISKKRETAAGHHARERHYWLNKLSGEWEKSAFIYDSPKRSGPRSFQRAPFRFEGESFSALMGLSAKSDRRLFMILLAHLVVLLYKYTGSTDVIVGMPIYKQEKEGDFINTVLALRNTFKPDISFKELLLQVRQAVEEAVKHQNYPIEALMHKLNLRVSEEHFPLFDIAILLENIHERNYLEPIKPNMVFIFRKLEEVVEGVLEYNESFYNASFVKGIIDHYSHLVHRMMNFLNMPLPGIDILLEEERKQVLFDFNDTGADYPMHKTVHELFEEQVERTPENIAVRSTAHHWRGYPGRDFLTYQELNETSNRLAHLLREKGVRPDSVVGLLMESSMDRIVAILGILKAGGAYLPIDHEFPGQRISSILDENDVSLLLTDERILARLPYTSLSKIAANKAKPIQTPPREQIPDFDALPFPDRTLVDYRKYHQYIGEAMAKHKVMMQTTRGCPYNCAFCHKIWPKKQIRRSAENIFQEILYCYNAGVRRFALIDDIFNLNMENGTQLFRKIINHKLDLQLFFCNGLRADILTKEYIDLMIEAGTVNIDVALETGSPRLQKLIRKNLNLEKFYENIQYITQKYPQVILEMEMMLGFPTETEEEAFMTLNFLKELKWIHFPNLHVLKIYPTSDMAQLAIEHGVKEELIQRSTHLAFHELPETLPFSKAFAREFQSRFMSEYFLLKERLLHMLAAQAKILAEDELVDKYDSYLPVEIKSFQDILNFAGISMEELGNPVLLPKGWMKAPNFNERIKTYFPFKKKDPDAFKVLLLDISQYFSSKKEKMIHNQNDEPLGLMYLLSYLNETFGARVSGEIFKAGVDFDSYDQLKDIILRVKPDLIGIRALSYYREFFHELVSYIRHLGMTVPIISGGPYATSECTFILQDPQVDVVVLGEGELTFAELVEKIMAHQKQLPSQDVLKSIKGITFLEKRDKTLLIESGREVIPLDRLSAEIARYPMDNPVHVNQPQDLLYLISTSGSTGNPKSVMLEHRNLNNLLHFQFSSTGIDFTDRVLQFASIGFDVSAQEIFSTLSAGGTLYLIDTDMKTDVHRLFDWIETNHISILFMPPSFLKLVFTEPEYTAMFPKSVKHIIAAGEQLVVTEAFRRHLKENRVYLHNHYGPSETHVVTTLTIDPQGEIPETPSIGKPISNTRIYILDENRNPVPIGVVGELYIAGSNVGRGYFGEEDLTKDKFMIDPFIPGNVSFPTSPVSRANRMYNTGDLARWLPDGTIEFIGRKDDQVKIRGFRIELGEIENHLRAIDEIREAVVKDRETGESNRGKGEKGTNDRYLCAYYVSDEEVAVSRLRDKLLDILPEYMMPTYFVHLEAIPLTANGKVDRKLLPDPEVKSSEKYIAPRDEIEKKLVGIWSEILDIRQTDIGIDSNFFELGGHSLKATVLIARIHKAFNVKISLGEMFNQPSIRGLAEVIKKAEKETFDAIQPAKKKKYYELSSAQKRVFIHHQMKIDNIIYNMPSIMLLEGRLDREKLESTFKQLIQRHEILRTSFAIVEGEPFQEVHEGVDFEIETHDFTDTQAEVEEAVPHLPNSLIKSFIRPFDLSLAPLVRVGLVKIGEEKNILMVDMHHIVTDGTSLGIFIRDFLALYAGEPLPELRIQYKDFSEWQNQLFRSGELEKQKAYWTKRFKDDIPVLDIPTDYPRKSIQSFKGAEIRFEIEHPLTAELKQVVLETETTLHIFLMAVFTLLLSKYSGQEDIVVGFGVAGRRHTDLENVMGLFVNPLPMRNRPQRDLSFMEFLEEVKENALNAYANQDYQYEELVKTLGIQGKPGRNPLFDFVFQVQNVEIPDIEIPGLKLIPYENVWKQTRFDLIVHIIERGDILLVWMNYSSELFKPSTIKKMGERFVEILDQVVKNREIKLRDIIVSQELVKVASTLLQEEQDDFEF